MNSLPFIAMNAFAEPLPHNFTTIHQKMQVFHAVFQGWGWIIEPSILQLLVLVKTDGMYVCHGILGGEPCRYLSFCATALGDLC